ncbi:hypothetical protein ACFE04_030413 [Oxalis oulophora]
MYYYYSPLSHTKLLAHNNVPFSLPHFHTQRRRRRTNASQVFSFLHKPSLALPPTLQVARGMRFDGPIVKVDELMEIEDGNLVMETCIVRTLPPALTLEHGLKSINKAVEDLKGNPPSLTTVVLRFQVAVPPSAKALTWFCSQPESSSVFPLFFLSKQTENPRYKSLFSNDPIGVFGMGAAIYFKQSSSCVPGDQSSIKRYLSTHSALITTYGFMDTNFNTESSSIKHEGGSFYFVIPQIELDETGDVFILTATLAWSNSFSCTFEQAILSYETSYRQAIANFAPSSGWSHMNFVRSALRKLKVLEDKTVSMVRININALLKGGTNVRTEHMQLKASQLSSQFCIRLSSNFVFSSNMLDCNGEITHSLQNCQNINAVWARLIVEECFRVGLTYFCIAPGSRSSPLAIAASSHPTITCISCFDERSLAFHALGYARGSHKPAVIITTSGTAVSNLLPAVVEASQDCVPMLLLTADRPPELQDAGANQSINQVNHLGSFVRFFFSLPPPSDLVQARMVLTTVDSAVNWAMSVPYGPAHINCPFREPLDNSQAKWTLGCLEGLDQWMHSSEPYTKYIQGPPSFVCHNKIGGQMTEVINVIRGAKKGLLLIGAIHTENDMWAALLLAKHLSWPVVADILSGVRLRKIISVFPESENHLLFVDHFDHALLSYAFRGWVQPDAVIQIGSRITSKRVSQMLEECFQCPYILVDSHPYRHDPSHIVTHRIQSTIGQFADCLLSTQFPSMSNKWSGYLLAMNKMVASEISFQIRAENSLTEPHLANLVSEALSSKSSLFIGNSMPIRDADMYVVNSENLIRSSDDMLFKSDLPFLPLRVAGNRGASGIDGLLSSAAGFSAGCNKHVFCVIGDISFLHDTNGLAILAQRTIRKPMTVLVVNNNGGAIFSLLPIADGTEPRVLNQFFYTTHNISIQKLCEAHGVKHLLVKTKVELQDALSNGNLKEVNSVIEVGSSITANASFHSNVKLFAKQAADHASSFLSRLFLSESNSPVFTFCKIQKMEFSLYRIQLCAPPTSSHNGRNHSEFYREGFILSLYLEDGSMGFGEVAPLGSHRESLADVEEQLRLLMHTIRGAHIGSFLPLLRGSFSSWIWNELGLPTSSILPSVRCGLEMAILNAIAASQGSSLLNILCPRMEGETEISGTSPNVQICALIDSNGTPSEVAHVAGTLVKEGFTTLKLKVARQPDPIHDAAIVQEVRNKIGSGIVLRVDANQNWTYDEAIQFGSLVKNCDLQYIEEPVQNEDDIIKYCEESGLPVALDETIDRIGKDQLQFLAKYTHPGIVAVVIKPSFVGGFENSALIAKWAQQMGKMAVVSAAFESGLGLSAYVVFSRFLELQNAAICKVMNYGFEPIAHGLGTYKWLTEDVTTKNLGIYRNPQSGLLEGSIGDATQYLQEFQINQNVICKTFIEEEVARYQLTVDSMGVSFAIDVLEIGQSNSNNVVLFLHGFLGTGEDWIPIMKGISGHARCISIDLPGHGRSKLKYCGGDEPSQDQLISIEVIAEVLYKLMGDFSPGNITLVGYSMGARIALYMALRFKDKIKGAVLISGSPGLQDKVARKLRTARDDSLARFLMTHGLNYFLDSWYTGELWDSLRSHPHFNEIVTSRSLHKDDNGLANMLSGLSIGRQPPLWGDLKNCSVPLSLIVGEKDRKFKAVAREMYSEVFQSEGHEGTNPGSKFHEVVEITDCGHAVHLENPLSIISAVTQFLDRL